MNLWTEKDVFLILCVCTVIKVRLVIKRAELKEWVDNLSEEEQKTVLFVLRENLSAFLGLRAYSLADPGSVFPADREFEHQGMRT